MIVKSYVVKFKDYEKSYVTMSKKKRKNLKIKKYSVKFDHWHV